MRSWLALVTVVGCGGEGDLPRTWTRTATLPHTLWWLSFDGEGRPIGIGKDDQHTYRYDESADLWSDLGLAPQWQQTVRDHAGNQYVVESAQTAGGEITRVHGFVNDTWMPLFDLAPGEVGGDLAFDASNNLYVRTTPSSGPDYIVYRWDGTALVVVVTGPTTDDSYTPSLVDDGQTLYLRDHQKLYVLDPGGTTTEVWSCALELSPWCVSPPADLHARSSSETSFVTYNDLDGTRFWRARHDAMPVLIANSPEGYYKVRQVGWTPDHGLFASIAVNNNGGTPYLFHLADGGEWTKLVEMEALAAGVWVSPTDGTVFSIDPNLYGMSVLR